MGRLGKYLPEGAVLKQGDSLFWKEAGVGGGGQRSMRRMGKSGSFSELSVFAVNLEPCSI